MNAQQAEMRLLDKAGKVINKNLIKEWIAQGHHLTGAWERSLHGTTMSAGNAVILTGTMEGYGHIVNEGVPADRIPYGGEHNNTGGSSKYISALWNYFKHRGLQEDEALRAAFATAKKHKKEGMPTSGSYAFSKTGQRTSFIQTVDKAIGPEVNKMVSDGLDHIVDMKFNETKSETI